MFSYHSKPKVLKVDNDNGIILVKGAVPGHKDCVLKF